MAAAQQEVFQPELIVKSLRLHRDRPLVHLSSGGDFTGAMLEEAFSRFTSVFAGIGIGKSVRVGLMSRNRIEVLHVANATMFRGAILVPLHPMGSVDDFEYIARDAALEVMIFDPEFDQQMMLLKERLPVGVRFYSLGDSAAGENLLPKVEATRPAPLNPEQVHGDEVFRYAYSGGTTGKPKAILITHRMMQTLTAIQMAEWEWPQEIRQLVCAPLSHAGAAVFLPTLLRGGTLFIEPRFDAETAMAAIERHRITCALLVPTMIYAILDHPRFGAHDLSSLQTVFYGAAPMSPTRLREAIERLGPIFFQFYGQSEAPVSVTVLRKDEHDVSRPDRLASCGRPVPWLSVELLTSTGAAAADGEPGEICVRGPLVMPGYLNRPAETAAALKDGWLRTGDVAVRDDRGYLRIVGRLKDMIITGGFNVYAREVEDALGTHPSISACAVFGLPDPHWGEIVCAAIVLREGQSVGLEELRAHVKRLKGAHQAPKRIEILPSLPMTALAKADKTTLRQMFAQP